MADFSKRVIMPMPPPAAIGDGTTSAFGLVGHLCTLGDVSHIRAQDKLHSSFLDSRPRAHRATGLGRGILRVFSGRSTADWAQKARTCTV